MYDYSASAWYAVMWHSHVVGRNHANMVFACVQPMTEETTSADVNDYSWTEKRALAGTCIGEVFQHQQLEQWFAANASEYRIQQTISYGEFYGRDIVG